MGLANLGFICGKLVEHGLPAYGYFSAHAQ